MSTTISVEHNAETAHRLPFMGGKCTNIHGHSWLIKVKFGGDVDENGIICDYGKLKRIVREWIDTYLDHGTMLGADDKLLDAFIENGSKVFVFGDKWGVGDLCQWEKMPWPTVEAVAEMLGEKLQSAIDDEFQDPYNDWPRILQVEVRETAVNYATWTYSPRTDAWKDGDDR